MVYKIRNKGFNVFQGMNNVRVFNARKTKITHEMGRVVTLQVHMTRYSGMRILQNYRGMSRAWKQFLCGDKLLEQTAILQLRWMFLRPFQYKSPIENNWYMGRTWADLLDKHYALFSQNQHPYQLALYEQYNKELRRIHSEGYRGQQSAIEERMDEMKQERQKYLAVEEGETLSNEDIADVYYQVMEEFRDQQTFKVRTKTKEGDLNDYLELRRPFGAGN